MVRGVGIDAADIGRVAKSAENPRFPERVFSEEERALIAAQPNGKRRAEVTAACFAAKEAFLKAAGVGLGGFALREIAALRHENGSPYYALSGAAAGFCARGGLSAHLSLTHEGGLALAVAVLDSA